jgi:hypothetical protein
MRAQTLVNRLELFIAAATLAAHASSHESGFRQRDVRFFAELFSNWAEADVQHELSAQNVQIQRYLDDLCTHGFARRSRKGRAPEYKLVRVGLLELLTRLTHSSQPHRPEHFLFLVFFITGYSERIKELVKREGATFPAALRIEVEAVLDVGSLLDEEIQRVRRQLAKLDARAADASRTQELVSARIASGVPFDEIISEVEKKLPYEFNSRKPLSELISSIQPDQRRWEMVKGNVLRAKTIWKPQAGLLKAYEAELKRLRAELE